MPKIEWIYCDGCHEMIVFGYPCPNCAYKGDE